MDSNINNIFKCALQFITVERRDNIQNDFINIIPTFLFDKMETFRRCLLKEENVTGNDRFLSFTVSLQLFNFLCFLPAATSRRVTNNGFPTIYQILLKDFKRISSEKYSRNPWYALLYYNELQYCISLRNSFQVWQPTAYIYFFYSSYTPNFQLRRSRRFI